MTVAPSVKTRYIPQQDLGISTLEQIVAVFNNADLYTLAADLVPATDPTLGGAPRIYPDWLIFGYGCLADIYGSARAVDSHLRCQNVKGTPRIWDLVRERVLATAGQHLPDTPPSRTWYVKRRRLVPPDTFERFRRAYSKPALDTAREVGLLDPNGSGTATHPSKERMLYADGKVIAPITSTPPGTTRMVEVFDRETGQRRTEHRPVRCELDARTHAQGDRTVVNGVKVWHCSVRGDDPNSRVMLTVDLVPDEKGKNNSENHVAVREFERLAPLMPGAQGVITDGVLQGRDINTIKRSTGWLVIAPISAKAVDKNSGMRTEKEVHVEDVDFLTDGQTEVVEIWGVGGRPHYADFDANGDRVLHPLVRKANLIRRNVSTNTYRHYIEVEVPHPSGGKSKQHVVRTYNNDEDAARNLNRAEVVRDIPPGDPDFRRLYGRREDAESINRGIDDCLPLRRARSYTAQRIVLDVLAHGFVMNSVTRQRHRLRTAAANAA